MGDEDCQGQFPPGPERQPESQIESVSISQNSSPSTEDIRTQNEMDNQDKINSYVKPKQWA
jgi:hypothetical protein